MSQVSKEESKMIINVHFERYNCISYIQGQVKYKMTITKNEDRKLYFGCINRHLASSNPMRCGATGHFDLSKKEYIPKRSHINNCGIDICVKFQVSDSYEVQKQLILSELNKNPRLTAGPACNLLMLENNKRPPEEKFITLQYDQVKHIITNYRNENGLQSTEVLKDAMILTKDNSLFLRFNSSFYSLFKGNFIPLLYITLIIFWFCFV